MTQHVQRRRPRRNPWLLQTPAPAATGRVFLLPYSGSSATSFHKWPAEQDGVQFCPVQLPGRESRLREPLEERYESLASACIEGLAPHLDVPFAFFGHCGSALLAYEITRRLDLAGGAVPRALVVSSEVAPHEGPYGRFLDMDDDELRVELERMTRAMGGEPLDSFMEMGLRVLKADLAANRAYHLERPEPVSCPVVAVGWDADSEIPASLMTGWSEYGSVTTRVLSGAHYDFLGAPEGLRNLLVSCIG